MNLADVATPDLINELASRDDVVKGRAGPFEGYELRQTYAKRCSADGTRGVLIGTFLYLPDPDHVDAQRPSRDTPSWIWTIARNEEQETLLLDLRSFVRARFAGSGLSVSQVESFLNDLLDEIKTESLCLYP